MWRRKSRPRPRPCDAPGIRPGTSATVKVCSPADTTPEVGRQRGERVVGDLGFGRRDRRHQRGFAGRRKPDQADVGDGLEFEGEVAGLALLAEQGETRRLAGPRRQRGVAQPAAAAGGGFEAGAGTDQIGEQPAVLVEHDGAVGHLDFQVGTGGTVAVAAHALLARRRVDMRMEVEVEQGVHLRVDDQHDAAAAAAVAAVGTAERLEFLAVDRGAAVTAGAGPRVDDDAVDKPRHRGSSHSSSVQLVRASHSQSGHVGRRSSGRAAETMLTVLRPRLTPNWTAPGRLGEQRVVAAAADVDAGVEVRAALADDDLAGLDDLAAEPLDAQPLGVGVATVA